MNPSSDRYSALIKVPNWDIEKLRNSTFLVAGAGALGNEVLKNLALLGVGRIVLIDFDRIERSNLSRSILFRDEDARSSLPKAAIAAQRVRGLSPGTEVVYISGDLIQDLGLGWVRSADAVIGCLDNRLARLYLNRFCHYFNKPWINGGILNISGQVNVFQPGKSCYECELSPKAWQEIRRRLGCADIAQRYQAAGQVSTTPISASIIGAIQVQEALKLVFGDSGRSLAGQKFYYEGGPVVAGKHFAAPLKKDCLSHSHWAGISSAPDLNTTLSVKETLETLKGRLGTEDVAIKLRGEVATRLAGVQSGNIRDLLVPRLHVRKELLEELGWTDAEAGFPPGSLFSVINDEFPYQEVSLSELGIPFADVIEVRTPDRRFYLELSGDWERENFEEGIFQVPLPKWGLSL